jgi:hypothetical protein
MSEDKKQNFVQVNYDLLATIKLNSTQKLFISYIIGWQKNELICRETNNNLASRFGKKYSGIRVVLNELNKYDFFDSVQKDYDEKNGTSGHEITVDEAKLKLFLNDAKIIEINNLTEPNTEDVINTIDELETKSELNPSAAQYHYLDVVNVRIIMSDLGFNNDEVEFFMDKTKSENVTFDDFCYFFTGIALAQKMDEYVGLTISEEQYELFSKMILDKV